MPSSVRPFSCSLDIFLSCLISSRSSQFSLAQEATLRSKSSILSSLQFYSFFLYCSASFLQIWHFLQAFCSSICEISSPRLFCFFLLSSILFLISASSLILSFSSSFLRIQFCFLMNLFSWRRALEFFCLVSVSSMLSRERSMPLMGGVLSLIQLFYSFIIIVSSALQLASHYHQIAALQAVGVRFIISYFVRMLAQNDEKKMLIESMKKLTSHVAGDIHRQKDIFQALSLHDFNKILSNLEDQNQYLRRISALFLCELFYRNLHNKSAAVTLLQIQPQWGRICLGGIPSAVSKYPSTLKKCVELMQSQVQNDELDKMCWVINLDRKTIKLEFLDYKKYSSFTFIDPAKHIFGFTLLRPKTHPRSPQKIIASQSNRYPTSSQSIQQRTLRGSLDRYQERQTFKEPVIPIKKSLNLNEKAPSRKISSSSTGSPNYKNQLGLFTKEQTAKKQVRPTTSEFGNRQHNRTYKVKDCLPPKKSVADSDYLSMSFNNSELRMATTDRLTPRSRVALTPKSTRGQGSVGQERFYKRVKDIIHK